MNAAAAILTAGFERLRLSNVSAQEKRKKNADYHIELQQLRQRWRLKKVGMVVIGDLSYKSGSMPTFFIFIRFLCVVYKL